MAITAVVGGQFGSEGKGKIAGYIAPECKMAIRTGGPNAGHTVVTKGKKFVLQSIPCAIAVDDCILAIGAGGVFDPDILQSEISRYITDSHKLIIDPMAGVIDPLHRKQAQEIRGGTGSPVKGVGPAHAHKALRLADFRLARDLPEFSQYIDDVSLMANQIIDTGQQVMLEGTQGFGLSLYHGTYPHTTSTDTTVGTLCGNAGVSVRLVEHIILVIRTYPIRGAHGAMKYELTWNDVARESGYPGKLEEMTTVTKHVRRVGKMDLDWVKRAIMVERPTQIALTFVDYVNYQDFGVEKWASLSKKTRDYIVELEKKLEVPITLISTGPDNLHTIDLRKQKL